MKIKKLTVKEMEAWLIDRLKDPLSTFHRNPETITKLVIKQLAYKFFKEVEELLNVRVLITEGFATEGHNEGSLHYQGKAIDFVLLIPPAWREQGRGDFAENVMTIGFLRPITKNYKFHLLNEYVFVTPATTGGHFHIEYEG